MKLASLKISIPVLMLLMSQSGYCVSNWFMEVGKALNRGDIYTAIRLTIENNPDSLILSDKSKADFINKTKELIKNDINSFIPKGIKDGEKEAFQEKIIKDMLALTDVTSNNVQDSFKSTIVSNQEKIIKDMLALTDVTSNNVQDSFKSTIVSNFYKNVGWLGKNESVYDEVTKVTTVYANSCVTGSASSIPEALLGRIGEFLSTYLSHKEDAESNKTVLTTLLSGANLTALGSEELDDTYYEIKGRVDAVEGTRSAGENNNPPERTEDDVTADQKKAIYNGLKSRADGIRSSTEKKVVDWTATDLENLSKDITGNNASDRAESLRKALYNEVAKNVADTDDLKPYLNLFGYWKIDQQEFLQKILDKIQQAPDDVEDAVYSTFGEEYENLLRHSDDADLARQKKLIEAVSKITSESTDDQKAEAVSGSIETLDNVTADKVMQLVKNIKNIG